MTTLKLFGEHEWVALWNVVGILLVDDILTLGKEIAQVLEMETVSNAIDFFPFNEKGGSGIQSYWAWTESFLVISTWPELGIFRVYLASCKSFDARDVIRVISETGRIQLFEFLEI